MIIGLGLLLTSYGIFAVNMPLVSSGILIMMCGSCTALVAMKSHQELLEDELSDDA